MATLESLPDNIILEILSYLPVKDLCISGRVNRRWRRIVRDNSLWRHVDLTPYRLDLSRMWKVIRAHFSDNLLTMKLKGFLRSSGPKQKKYSLSDAMMNDLEERCPNIKTMQLIECNTDNLDCRKIPNTLTSLSIQNSTWQPGWFKITKDSSPLLPHLKYLDLSGCSRVDNFDIEDFIKLTHLEYLILNKCYRVNESGLTSISQNLLKLKRLEISGTGLSELSIHHISRHLSELEYLNISYCSEVSNSFLGEITSGLLNLKCLDISGCSKITDEGMKLLENIKLLKIIK